MGIVISPAPHLLSVAHVRGAGDLFRLGGCPFVAPQPEQGRAGRPNKEDKMKVYAVIWTFGLIVVAISIRIVLELAIALQGRSWS